MIVRRGPGLLGTMARTAAIAGTATAVSGGLMRRQQARAQQAAQAASQTEPQRQPQPAGATDVVGQLKRLADLRASGAITDAEFTAAKAKLLG